MGAINCNFKGNCTIRAIIASVIIGVISAFLQITAVITIAPAFLWVTFGIAIVYLGVLILAAALARRTELHTCICTSLTALLAGILGTILFAVILLAVGVIATSVISAILVGLLLLFFTLTVTSSACYIKCLADCAD